MRHPGKYWALDENKGVSELTILEASLRSEEIFQALFIVSQQYPGIEVLARKGKLHGDQPEEPSSL